MDGLITTDLDQVAAELSPVFFTAVLLFYFEVYNPILIESGR